MGGERAWDGVVGKVARAKLKDILRVNMEGYEIIVSGWWVLFALRGL